MSVYAAGSGNFGDFQEGIYAAGVGGVQPRFPLLYGVLRNRAQQVLDAPGSSPMLPVVRATG
ncbi:MAG: hypothetical protein ABSD32_22030 [Mycobacterium sp.]|jgi:hypothetical protein